MEPKADSQGDGDGEDTTLLPALQTSPEAVLAAGEEGDNMAIASSPHHSSPPGKASSFRTSESSAQERVEDALTAAEPEEKMLPDSCSATTRSEETEQSVDAWKRSSACDTVSGKAESRRGGGEEEEEEVMLSDGPHLQGETDVDGVSAGVCPSGGGGEVVNKLHHTLGDLSSMSPSISTDKTLTSSTLSSSSLVDGDSLRSVDPADSSLSPSRALLGKGHTPASSRHRTVPEASACGSSRTRDSDRMKSEEKIELQEKNTHKVETPTSANTSATDGSQKRETETSPTPQEAGSRDHPNLNDAHHNENGESANCLTSTEPFSSFVDVSRLNAALGQGGTTTTSSSSGNVQEQQLQTLVGGVQQDPRSLKQLKKVLRSGSWAAHSTVRKVAWLQVCSHLHKLEKAFVYVQMEKELFGDLEDENIPVPSWPQQPSHDEPVLTEYFLTPKGKNTAHKIVAVIGQLSPDITYCPALLPLVDLFLHYMGPEDCFSCALTLLQSRSLVYLMQSRVAFEASKKVVKDLAKKYVKSAYVSLVRSCSNVEPVFDNWLGWIYSDLPFSYVVAVTDSFLLEGIKVLYRVVLAILVLYTKHSGQGHRGAATDSASVAQAISQLCRRPPVPPDRLLKMAFKIRGFSRKKLMKLQNLHESLMASGAVSTRPDMPRIASRQSMENVSMAVSMAHPNTRLMGFHNLGSNILSVDQLVTIWSWLPSRHAICPPTMLFNSADLGTSLMTLYAHIELEPCTVIVIKTVDGEVFGAFCADSWYERRTYSRPVRFFGTGETFLFTLVPERNKYEWVGKPDPHVPLSANMFQAGDNTSLLVGGGDGCGIQLDGMMERCRTETCATFNNPPLCPAQDFVPAAIEVFGISNT